MPTLPSSLALEVVDDGSQIVASEHRNNYSAIQQRVNDLLSILDDGVAGQVLTGNGTTLTWAAAAGMVQLYDNTVIGSVAANWDRSTGLTGYNHLLLHIQARGDTAATDTPMLLRLNNDSAGNYDWQHSAASAAAITAAETFAATSVRIGSMPANTGGASLFNAATILIPNYGGAIANKSLTGECSLKIGTASGNLIRFSTAGFWRSSTAVTRVTILPTAGNLQIGSRLTIYGLL